MAAAAKKNNKTKAPAKSGTPAGRRSVSGRTGAEAKTPAMPPEREENRLYRLLGGLACLLLALCTAVSYFQADALLLGLLRQALTGLFGYGYWLWAAAFLAMGLFLLLHREQKALGRVLCTALIPLLAGSLLHLALASNTRMQAASALWREGQGLHGGGVLSGGLAAGGAALVSPVVFVILAVCALIACGFVVLRTTPGQVAERARQRSAARAAEYDEETVEDAEEDKRTVYRTGEVVQPAPKRRPRQIDIPLDGDETQTREEAALPQEETALPPETVGFGVMPKKRLFSKRSQQVRTPDEVLRPRQEAGEEAAEGPECGTPPEERAAMQQTPAHDDSLTAADAAVLTAAAPSAPPAAQPLEREEAEVRKKIASEVQKATEEVSQAIEQELAEPEEQYHYPPITLLDENRQNNFTEVGAELRSNSRRLADTLQSFGVVARAGEVVHGPSVTRYEFMLEQGVKLSKITNLSDDIALALGASGVRIAPVPGKISAVGIEVPNRAVTPVRIRDVIESRTFAEHPSPVAFAVGKDIGGNQIVGDIARLPHVLIAGTTGSGKSVCTNSLIISMLYKSTPEEVRFIMVDPKMVELAPYNGIPHLLIPVVTDPKKAAGALQWAVFEMMKRYKAFSEHSVKDLAGYNALAGQQEDVKKLPSIVVVIDELADLMLVAAKEVEESICRVAQMGRAAGMHLVIATQRPSADVITGLMKANIPSRIAFAVASSLESRIILDTPGAEKLVGKGDMLYAPLGAGKPTRVQGCFITPEEIERVVAFVKESGEASYSTEVMDKIEQAMREKDSKGSGKQNAPAEETPGEEWDELLPAAVDVILETGQASVSMLQRRLKLGYSRAARLVDQMEERGIVGPFEGSKPRQLLIDKAKWQEMQMQNAPAPEPEIDRSGSIRDVFESRDALE